MPRRSNRRSAASTPSLPAANRSVTVVYGANNWSTTVTGSTNAYFTVGNWRLADGRVFTRSRGARRQSGLRDRRNGAQATVRSANPRSAPRLRIKQFFLRSHRPAGVQGPVGDGHGSGRHRRDPAAHAATAADRQSGRQHPPGLGGGQFPHRPGHGGFTVADARAPQDR